MSGYQKIIFLVLVILFGLLPGSGAYQISNLEFKDTFKRGTVELSLQGTALKKFLSLRVAAAGLYLKKGTNRKDILADVPKSLEVIYLQNIPAIELQRATTKGVRLNVSEKEFHQLLPRIDILNSIYPNVRKMDRIQVSYIPGNGTIVEINGVVKQTIPGADFGRAFFAIWFGDRPVDPLIKKVLLGKLKK